MNEEEPDFEPLRGAVAGLRQLASHLRKTTAPRALLRDIERDVAALNERLCAEAKGIFIRPKGSILEYVMAASVEETSAN